MNQQLTYELAAVMPMAIETGMFTSLCTIQSAPVINDTTGAATGAFTPVAGLTNLPCTAPPVSSAKIAATEVKALQEVLELEVHHILLNGFYPAIRTYWKSGANCVIDGLTFDIIGTESDAHYKMTRLMVRIASI